MAQLTFASVAAAFDVSDSVNASGQPPTSDSMQKLNHNGHFAAVRPERIYMGFFGHGDVVPLPVSPVDGYAYTQAEVQYSARLVSTRAPESGFVAGQKNLPQIAGVQIANLYYTAVSVDDNSGAVGITVSYYKQDGAETVTNDGLVKIYAVCQRNDVSPQTENFTAPGNLLAETVPAPTNWLLTANLGGDLRLSFAIPSGADYLTGYLNLLYEDELNRVKTTLMNALLITDTTMLVNDSTGFLVGDSVHIGPVEGTFPADPQGLEIVKIVGPGVEGAMPTSQTWQIARGQIFSYAAAALVGAAIYRLTPATLSFEIQPGYTLAHPTINLPTGPYYVQRFRPGRMRILWAALLFADSNGQVSPDTAQWAPVGVQNIYGALAGLRSSKGDKGTIQIAGPLATGADLAMPLILPDGVSIGIVYAGVASTPLGLPIRFQLKLDGVNLGPVGEIPAGVAGLPSGTGVFFSGAQQGNVGGGALSIEILQVGSSDPGKDLTVNVTV